MSKRIFRAIWTASIVVFLAALVLIMGASYKYFTGVQQKQLKNETILAAQGVAISGMDYLDDLEGLDYRVTWINSDGTVIYDNSANQDEMENHIEREEIQEAIESGYGESMRRSGTLSDKELYSAVKIPDGYAKRYVLTSDTWVLSLMQKQTR